MLQKLTRRIAGRGAETDRLSPALAILASLFFALPLPLTTLAVRFGPSGFDPAAFPPFAAAADRFAAAELLGGFLLILFSLGRKRLASFFVAWGCSLIALIGVSVFLGVLAHPDFFSPAIQYGLSIPVVLFLRLRASEDGISRTSMKALGRAGYVIAAFYAEWIILVGYAIVTRNESRPVESLLYNSYNVPLVLILFLASRGVERRGMRTLSIGADGVAVDGKSIDAMLGERRSLLLAAFVAASDRRLRCPDVQRALAARAHGSSADRVPKPDCRSCVATETKATDCAEYRSAYNSLLDLKKMLEFLEIGSITSPENRRRVLADGWRLTLFENARIVLH